MEIQGVRREAGSGGAAAGRSERLCLKGLRGGRKKAAAREPGRGGTARFPLHVKTGGRESSDPSN